jgi:hypothetical protein
MITRVNSMSGTGAMSAVTSAALAQMKTELTTALKAAGITDASETDTTPKGFPNGVTWANAYKMVAEWKEDGNPATPGNLVLSQDLVNKNVAATKSLKELGYKDLSSFKAGTSVVGAIDTLYQSKTNGLVGSALAKAGIYDLNSFPKGTTVYQAFKLIEDPENPGKLSTDRYRELKAAFTALSALGVTSLANFPRGSNALDAKAVLEPKAVQMVAMSGMTPANFKNSNLSALEQMGILSKLPDTIRELNALPTGTNANQLGTNAIAAKKLVALGYESLDAFAGMKAFGGKPVTAAAALMQVTKNPVDADLPFPTAASTDRLFQSTDQAKIPTYGKINPVKYTVYSPNESDKVKPNPPPIVTVTTTAEILAANIIYWQRKT